MICEKCDVRLKVTHTYNAGDAGKTQSAICPKCKTRYTITSFVEKAKHGKGAYAKAQQLKNPPSES